MSWDKQSNPKWSVGARPSDGAFAGDESVPTPEEPTWLTDGQTLLKTMVSRAAKVYLVLFLGLGLGMSALSLSPLVNNGFMPKVLLAFVGLALVIVGR